jgi:hypothetical protein
MNRMMAAIWVPFVVPQTLRDNLSAWYVDLASFRIIQLLFPARSCTMSI